VAPEPSDVYAHVTTSGLPGAPVLTAAVTCEGVLQSEGEVPANSTLTTPAEFHIIPVANNGAGCTVSVSVVITGQDMGKVQAWLNGTP
jgi:hypothetical protein